MLILGHVQGNVVASGRVELRAGCNVEGDIRALRLAVEDNAVFRGKVDLTQAVPGPRGVSSPAGPASSESATFPACSHHLSGRKRDSGCCAIGSKRNRRAASPLRPGPLGPQRAAPLRRLGCAAQAAETEPGLGIMDSGYTSPANINYLTSLGHSVFLADLVHDACTENWQTGADEDGNPIWNVEGYLKQPSTSPAAPSMWCCCGPRSTTCRNRWSPRWSLTSTRP